MGNACPSSVELDNMVTYRDTINPTSFTSEEKIATLPIHKNKLIGLIFAVKNYELNNIPYTVTPIGSTTTQTCVGSISINKDNLIAIKKQLNEKAEILNLGQVSGFNSDNNPIPFPEVAYISLINNIPNTSVPPICDMVITGKTNQEEAIVNFTNRANIDPTIIDYGYIDVLNSIDGIKAFEAKLPNYNAKSPSDTTTTKCITLNVDVSQLVDIKKQHNSLIKFFNTNYGKPLVIPFPEVEFKPEDAKAEPAKPEPAKPEPAKAEPINIPIKAVMNTNIEDNIINGIPNMFIYFMCFIIFIIFGYFSASYLNAKQIQRDELQAQNYH
jgi:hypothetical protein